MNVYTRTSAIFSLDNNFIKAFSSAFNLPLFAVPLGWYFEIEPLSNEAITVGCT